MTYQKLSSAVLTFSVCLIGSISFAQESESPKSAAKKTVGKAKSKTPTPKQIVERHVELVGGYEMLQSLESVHCRMSGTPISKYERENCVFESFVEEGNCYVANIYSDHKVEWGWQSDLGWMRIAGKSRKLDTAELRRIKRHSYQIQECAGWIDESKELILKGIEEFNGRETYHIQFVRSDDSSCDRFLNTGLLFRFHERVFHQGLTHDVNVEFLEYQQKGEFLICSKRHRIFGTERIEYTLDLCEFDVEIPEETFELPERLKKRSKRKK